MEELKPIYQKSFYGKAHIVPAEFGIVLLKSYDTIVAGYDTMSGRFIRYWSGTSKTTLRHINAFRVEFGLDEITSKQWMALPIDQ